MRYGNQLVTMAVVAPKQRLEGIRDVVDLMRGFADDYGRRFGQGSQSPEAGIRVTTIRVASYVEGETVYDESALEPGLVVRGPAIVTTPATSYLVEPGWRIETGAHGAIWFLRTPEDGAR